MKISHLIAEARSIREASWQGVSPTDFGARIRAIPGYQHKSILKSFLDQVSRGRTLSDKQVAVLDKIEKEAPKNQTGLAPDPHMVERIYTTMAKAIQGVWGNTTKKTATKPRGFVKMVRGRSLPRGGMGVEFIFDNGFELLDFGAVKIDGNGDRDYNGIASNDDYERAMRQDFIDTAERAIAGLVPPHSTAKNTRAK